MKRCKIIYPVFFLLLTVVLLFCACAAAEEEYPPAYPLPELSGNMLEDFLAVARSQVGYAASETNLSEYWIWADGKSSNYNWCSDFVAWCAAKANIPETMMPRKMNFRSFFSDLGRYYKFENDCTSSIDGCLELSSGTILVEDLQPGDLVLMESHDNIDDGPDHTAIVEKVEGNVITLLHGNVGKINENGIRMGKVREIAYEKESILIHGVCRVFVYPDSSSIASFVSRCYSIILGRDADVGGLTDWTNQLTSGAANASQIISGFLNSEEFINQNSSNSETVDILYNTMLNRSADEAGKEYWVDILNGSGSNTVINGFCGSQEFLALCQEYGIAAGSVPVDQSSNQPQPASNPTPEPRTADTEKITDFINRCYSLILSRNADEGGLNNWVNVLSSGTSNASQIVSGFMGSEEYTNNNYDSAETIEVLYNTMLGRPSDPAGKQYWIDVLYSQGINAVIDGFRSSQEFNNICNEYGITP